MATNDIEKFKEIHVLMHNLDQICKKIRSSILNMILQGNDVKSDRMTDIIHKWMESQDIKNHMSCYQLENTEWIISMLTCKQPIAQVFIEFSDVITAIIPEIKPCVGFDHHSIYHKHNIYEHILAVVDGCDTDDFCIKMAALLHDIGKPNVYTKDKDGYYHYKGHAEESVQIAKKVLSNFYLSNEEKKTILELIECHDMQLAATKKSVNRAVTKYGTDFIRKWAVLRLSDRNDHVFPKGTNTRFFTDIDGILELADKIEFEKNEFKVTDLAINGRDLMQELGLTPGKELGQILEQLRKACENDFVGNTKEELLSAAALIIATKSKNPEQIKKAHIKFYEARKKAKEE